MSSKSCFCSLYVPSLTNVYVSLLATIQLHKTANLFNVFKKHHHTSQTRLFAQQLQTAEARPTIDGPYDAPILHCTRTWTSTCNIACF